MGVGSFVEVVGGEAMRLTLDPESRSLNPETETISVSLSLSICVCACGSHLVGVGSLVEVVGGEAMPPLNPLPQRLCPQP